MRLQGGADPLRAFPSLPCTLDLHLTSVKHPGMQGGHGGGGPSLFVPTLGSQRMEVVAGLLREAGARTVVDIGE